MSWSSSLTRHDALGIGLAVYDVAWPPHWRAASQTTVSAERQICATWTRPWRVVRIHVLRCRARS
jgi:hypothetical protein